MEGDQLEQLAAEVRSVREALNAHAAEDAVWVKDIRTALGRLEDHIARLEDVDADLGRQVRAAAAAANRAANAALDATAAVQLIKTDVADALAAQTTEILRLIRMDGTHSERIVAVEEQIAKSATSACEKIEHAGDKAGKDLSRKVAIPVSLISAIAVIVQYALSAWLSR